MRFTADVAGDGPLALCLHGFPDHRRTWRHLLPALAAAGFRAVAPDLRGYASASQPPDGAYDLAALAGDVVAWIDQLGGRPAHLIGHDWGAIIAHCVAALAPDRLASLTTLAVPPLRRGLLMATRRPRALRKLWYIAFFQLRGLPERALLDPDGRLIRRLWRDWSPGWTCPEPDLARVLDTFQRPGVAQAALGYYRALPQLALPRGGAGRRLAMGTIRVPALLLTGARDGCLDSALYDAAVRPGDLPPGSRVERLPDLGHFLHLEDPPAVERLVLDWLRAQPAPP